MLRSKREELPHAQARQHAAVMASSPTTPDRVDASPRDRASADAADEEAGGDRGRRIEVALAAWPSPAPSRRAGRRAGASPAAGGRKPVCRSPRGGPRSPSGSTGDAMAELTTVADDEAVVHDGARRAHATTGSTPDTDYELDGFAFRTLPRPRRAAGHGRHRQRRALRRGRCAGSSTGSRHRPDLQRRARRASPTPSS